MHKIIRCCFFSFMLLMGTASYAMPAGTGGGYSDTICQYSVASVTDTGTGNWTAMATNPSTTIFTTPNANATSIVGFDSVGTYAYVWHKTGGLDTIYVVVKAKPNAGPDQIICQYYATQLAAVGPGMWSFNGSPAPVTFANIDSPRTLVSGFTVAGDYVFIWSSNGCADTSIVHVTAKPNAGPDQTICQYNTTNLTAVGSGIWSFNGSPAPIAFASIDSPRTLVSGFTVAGDYVFIWSSNGCADTSIVHVTAKPNAGPDQTVSCFATGTATMAATGSGLWTALATNPGSSTIVSFVSGNTTIRSFSAPGTYSYIWTVSGCTDTANITVGAVANDACSGAVSMGTLPTPAACSGVTGINNGTTVTLTGQSNTCASPSQPFPYQLACPISITSPPKDVWYSFVASSTRATISVSGASFSSPVVSVWSGACGTLNGIGCATGTAGAASVTVYQLTAGTTYYIQVSGTDSTQYGTFNLNAFSSIDCSGCLVTSHVVATPPPVNGTYYPGQTVTFCYTVTGWNQTSANWLHGIITNFGSGWDMSTFVPGAVPPSCSADGGHWEWHQSGDTSVATGNRYTAGFYYETTSGSSTGVLDGDPGNNFGDDDTHNCTWTFCVTITSASTNCLAGENLNVSFHTTGDGESGSWSSFACSNDPTVTASNVGACCPPTISTTGASCSHNDGTATATPTGHNGPWKYSWSNGVVQNGMTGPATITGLVVGLYTVTVIDINNCVSTASDSVRAATKPNGGGTKYVSCPQLGDSAFMTAVGNGNWYALTNPAPTNIVSPDSAHTAITGFTVPATYNYVWAIGNCYDTVPVIVTIKPNAGPDQNVCTKDTAFMGAFGTGTWSALPGNPAPITFADPNFDSTAVTGFTAGGVYNILWTTGAGCSDTMQVTVPFYNIALSAASYTICQYSNTTITVTPTLAQYGPFSVTWLDSTKVQNPHSASTSINSLGQSTYFHVQVTDAAGCKLTDSVLINTTTNLGTDIRAGGSPTLVCPGTPAILTVVANPNSCGAATTICSAAGTTVVVGTGTSSINGPGSQYPAPYGNYYKSARHQFLIHASEILGQVASGGQIKSLSLDVGSLNSGPALDHFTISLGCVPDDSIGTDYFGGLTQVYSVAAYQPVAGWNTHTFTTAYNWDGRSNIVVDICFVDTSGSHTNPKMVYTTTPFRSVYATYNNFNGGVCGVPGNQAGIAMAYAKYFQRPNMKLNVCTTDLTGANLVWTPSAGPGPAPTPNNLDTVEANPTATTTYQVALTSSNGCINYDYVTISVDTTSKLSFNNDTFVCSVQPIRLSAVVTGDSVVPANVTYTWTASTGNAPASGTGPTFANVTVSPSVTTLYTVTTSGGGGCTLFDSMRVTVGNGLPVRKVVDSITCGTANNGQININMNAGVPPYRYTWTPAVAGNVDSAIGLAPGTYIVQVTDTQGCAGTDTTRLTAPTPLALTFDSVNLNCANSTIDSITAHVAGGRPVYHYAWSSNASAGNTPTLTNVPAGTYTLTVHDTSGCTISGAVNITQPSPIVSTVATTNLTGAGTDDGTITLSTSGGVPAYTYSSAPAVTGLPNATGLDTGIYIITICDANHCCINDTAHISGPPPIVVVPVKVNNLCYGQCSGSISVTASGGVAPYKYQWSVAPADTFTSVSDLCAGSYVLTVTDSNGISVSNTYIITAPTQLRDSIDSVLITCNGANNGALTAYPYGGTAPYTVVWTPGGNNPLSNLGQGTYVVQITDSNSCQLTDTASLGQPAPLTSVLDSTYPATCYGYANGRAVISIAGGTPPYNISWSGSTSVDTVATDLGAGTHTVTITDAHGCPTSVSVTITQPLQIVATVTTIAAHCATSDDGSATATVTNGTAPYTYLWDNVAGSSTVSGLDSGTHTLIVTDAGGCQVTVPFYIDTQYVLHLSMAMTPVTCYGGADGTATVTTLNGGTVASYLWSNSTTVNPATGLSASTPHVTVTDNLGCIATDSIEVTQPTQVAVVHTVTDPLCAGGATGTVSMTASGGTGPYTFVWNGTVHPITDVISGVAAGTYIDSVMDSKGCPQADTVTLVDPLKLAQTIQVKSISCANTQDGVITSHVTGGTPGYTYQWTPTAPGDSADSKLGPGTYDISITDANGCTVDTSIVLNAPPLISFTYIRADSVSCADSSDGHILVDVTGGTPGTSPMYTYSINGGASQTDSNFYSLAAGTYQIAVYDSMHCQLDTSLPVYSPLPVNLAIDPLDTILPLGNSITLTPLITNVTSQNINSYNWSPSDGLSCIDCGTPVATPYQRQIYTLVLRYGKNCTTSASATLGVGDGPQVYIPNAFSPNGDGTNDEFTAFGTTLKGVGIKVFNRWGEKVFDSMDSQWASWDGTYKGSLQPTGVYVYEVQLTYLNDHKETRRGSLTLIR